MPNLSWKGFLDLRCWLFWDILSRDLSQLHSHFIISCQFEVADVPVECQKCFPLWWCIWGSLYGATSGTCKLLYDEVYMRKFLVNLKWEFIVCKIKKVIYKLKQNPRVWFVIFSTIIVGAGGIIMITPYLFGVRLLGLFFSLSVDDIPLTEKW